MNLKKRAASVVLAAILGVTGGTVAAVAAPDKADAACCLRIPDGTWGGHVRAVDVPLYTRDNGWTLVRRKTVVKKRMVDGRWQERVYSIELYTVRHV